MTSRTKRNIWRAYATLDKADRRAAKEAFRRFIADPSHPSLHFQKLAGHDGVWSVRASLDLRAVGRHDGELMRWTWIGHHGDFDNLFGKTR